MKLFNKHFTIGFGQQKIKHMVDGVHTCLNNISQLFFSDTWHWCLIKISTTN